MMKPIARLILRDDGEGNGLIIGSILKNKGDVFDFEQVYQLDYDDFLGSGFHLKPVGKSTVKQVLDGYKDQTGNYCDNWFHDVSYILRTGKEIFLTQEELQLSFEIDWKKQVTQAYENDGHVRIHYQEESFWSKPRLDLGDNLFEVCNNTLSGLVCGNIISLDSLGRFVCKLENI